MLNPASFFTAARQQLERLQPAHFPVPAALMLLSLPIAMAASNWAEQSSLHLLAWLLLALGAALCGVFQRWQQLSLLVWVLVLQVGLLPDVQAIRLQQPVSPAIRADFILATTLWPAFYSLLALWPDPARPLPGLCSRIGVLALLISILNGLHRHPQLPMVQHLGQIWWPALQAGWMHLPQLGYVTTVSGLILLGWQYLLEPRPQHAAQWLVLAGCIGLLPQIFIHPDLLPVSCSLALLALAAAVVQESLYLAFRDELTGLPSRRALHGKLRQLSRQYCLAVVDIDHFKQCNDRHGHDVGDQVLRMVASRLRQGSRGRAYRQGGEEFVIVLERCDLRTAQAWLEAMRKDIADYPMRLRNPSQRPAQDRRHRGPAGHRGADLSVTVSIGLAAGRRADEVATVLQRADQALYQAKAQGRNQTVRG